MHTSVGKRGLGFGVVFVAALGVAACGKGGGGSGPSAGGGGGDCGALKVTVDGQPLDGLTHGYAVTHKRSGDTVQQVDLFNHETACADLLSKSGRKIPNGEETVRAFTGGHGAFGQGLGIEVHAQMGIDVALASEAPKATGDKVALCVPETTFKPAGGKYKGKTIVMSGRFEGTWCGVFDWDAK